MRITLLTILVPPPYFYSLDARIKSSTSGSRLYHRNPLDSSRNLMDSEKDSLHSGKMLRLHLELFLRDTPLGLAYCLDAVPYC